MTHDPLNTPGTTGPVDVTAVEIRAGERIRWGAIVAGLFAALSTLILLTVLGAAIGLSAYDANDPNRAWTIGAGIWSAISMIVAFIVGGWIAGRWGAPYGFNSPLLHGAMVWAVAIPLSLWMLGNVGTMFGSAAAANRDTTVRTDRFDAAQPAGATIGEQATGASATEQVTDTAASAAWGTLIALLLGLGAAALGGYLGAGGDRDRFDRTRTRTGTTTTTT